MSHKITVTEERLDDLAWGHRLSWNQLADAIGLTAREYADKKAGLIPFTAGEINRLAELLHTSVASALPLFSRIVRYFELAELMAGMSPKCLAS